MYKLNEKQKELILNMAMLDFTLRNRDPILFDWLHAKFFGRIYNRNSFERNQLKFQCVTYDDKEKTNLNKLRASYINLRFTVK